MGTVGERGRAQGHWGDDEHSAHRTVMLVGPRPCSLQRAQASASARRELKRAWTKIVAKIGKARQSRKQAHEQQRLGRDPERVGTQVDIM